VETSHYRRRVAGPQRESTFAEKKVAKDVTPENSNCGLNELRCDAEGFATRPELFEKYDPITADFIYI
jgi:hypothetical protein